MVSGKLVLQEKICTHRECFYGKINVKKKPSVLPLTLEADCQIRVICDWPFALL